MNALRFACVLSWGLVVLICDHAVGQAYPNRTIRIVTSGVGGGTDFAARAVAQGISPGLGHPVIVDNRPSGVIPGDTVAKSAPDGYTLLATSNTFWLTPFLQNGVPYDPVKDFATLSTLDRAPNILVVHPSLPVTTVKGLIALAKAHPGELNNSTGTTGSSSHLAAELFKSLANIKIVRIAYKNGATQMADLVGGQVQLAFGNGGIFMQLINSGKLRALAVGSAEPSTIAPDLPTIAASGLPGYKTSGTITGMWVPAKTPEAIINRLNQEIVRYLKTPEARERYVNTGAEVSGSTPAEFAAIISADMIQWGKIIKDGGFRAD
jgi:tripartite-type tricarboxylate transporter receptor subunit TctC